VRPNRPALRENPAGTPRPPECNRTPKRLAGPVRGRGKNPPPNETGVVPSLHGVYSGPRQGPSPTRWYSSSTFFGIRPRPGPRPFLRLGGPRVESATANGPGPAVSAGAQANSGYIAAESTEKGGPGAGGTKSGSRAPGAVQGFPPTAWEPAIWPHGGEQLESKESKREGAKGRVHPFGSGGGWIAKPQ